jgi:hypothetical protein
LSLLKSSSKPSGIKLRPIGWMSLISAARPITIANFETLAEVKDAKWIAERTAIKK